MQSPDSKNICWFRIASLDLKHCGVEFPRPHYQIVFYVFWEIAVVGALALELIISFAEIEVMIAAGRFSAIAFFR